MFHRDFLAPSGSGLGFRGLSPFFSFVSFLRNGAPNEVLLRMNVVETWFVAVWGLCWCNYSFFSPVVTVSRTCRWLPRLLSASHPGDMGNCDLDTKITNGSWISLQLDTHQFGFNDLQRTNIENEMKHDFMNDSAETTFPWHYGVTNLAAI